MAQMVVDWRWGEVCRMEMDLTNGDTRDAPCHADVYDVY